MTDHTAAAAHYAIQHEHANDLNELKRLREEVARKDEQIAELVGALQSASSWHQGDKWRNSPSQCEFSAWEKQRDLIDAALTKAEAK